MSTIYQHGTLELIMSGLYDGTAPLSSILNHGSSGIGTMDELDGEVTIIENSVYQTKANGVTIVGNTFYFHPFSIRVILFSSRKIFNF